MERQESRSSKIVIVGDKFCGKTSLVKYFVKKDFSDAYVATTFQDIQFDITLNNTNFHLKLCDTAGRLEFDGLRQSSYPGANIVLLCFSIGNPKSLAQAIKKFYPEISQFSPLSQVIMVGCKVDLRVEESDTSKHVVSLEDVLAKAGEINCYSYAECSAKTGEGVHAVFEVAADAALEGPRLPVKESSKKSRNLCVMN